MTRPTTIMRAASAAALLAFSVGATAMPAHAKPGDVKTSGKCSAASVWKLKLGPRDGGIETEFEVDSNRNGQRWNVRIMDNGVQVASGVGVTAPPSGSFEFRRRLVNKPGVDRIVAVATNRASGETCRGVASV